MKGDLGRYREIFYFALEQARQTTPLYLHISHNISLIPHESPCLSSRVPQSISRYISFISRYLHVSRAGAAEWRRRRRGGGGGADPARFTEPSLTLTLALTLTVILTLTPNLDPNLDPDPDPDPNPDPNPNP